MALPDEEKGKKSFTGGAPTSKGLSHIFGYFQGDPIIAHARHSRKATQTRIPSIHSRTIGRVEYARTSVRIIQSRMVQTKKAISPPAFQLRQPSCCKHFKPRSSRNSSTKSMRCPYRPINPEGGGS